MSRTAYRAVVFDLDGTLLDTLADLADAVNSVLAERRLPIHATEEYRLFVGDGATLLMTRVLPVDLRDAETVRSCVIDFTEAYGRHWNRKTHAYSGVPEMLDALTSKGVPMAVLSNKPDAFTQMCVRDLLPRWRFFPVLGQGPDVPRKPDPTGAKMVADSLQLPPSDILYVGDTGTDMETAVACGMFPVGALWGFRTKDELLAHGASVLLEHPHQLLDVVDGTPMTE